MTCRRICTWLKQCLAERCVLLSAWLVADIWYVNCKWTVKKSWGILAAFVLCIFRYCKFLWSMSAIPKSINLHTRVEWCDVRFLVYFLYIRSILGFVLWGEWMCSESFFLSFVTHLNLPLRQNVEIYLGPGNSRAELYTVVWELVRILSV